MSSRHFVLALIVLILAGTSVEVFGRNFTGVYLNFERDGTCGEAPLNPLATTGNKPEPYIVSGWAVRRGDWPSLALVSISGLECSGVIVRSDLVLTAGHCLNRVIPFRDEEERWLDETKPGFVVVGMTDRQAAGQGRVYEVERIQKGGFYRERGISQHEADLGRVFLRESIQFDEYAQSACIPSTEAAVDELLDSVKYPNTYVIGYGGVGRLNETDYMIPRLAQGLRIRKVACRARQNFETDICFAPTDEYNRGICKGDSGAPALVLDHNMRWTLVAIATGAYNCNSTERFQSAGLDRYLKLSKLVDILKDDYERFPTPKPDDSESNTEVEDPNFRTLRRNTRE